MSTHEKDIVWQAEAHTIAKVAILESYLVAWFQIMGRTMSSRRLVYVDGFAGPGKYRNYPTGSPIAALRAAGIALKASGGSWKASDIHCIFIEEDRNRFEHLCVHVQPFSHPRLKVHLKQGTFEDKFWEVVYQRPSLISLDDPLFVFIDPFGATGSTFETVTRILQKPSSEVLINFDADGIARIFAAGSHAARDTILNDIYGTDNWKSVLTTNKHKQLTKRAVDLYVKTLQSIPVKYVFPFEMQYKSGMPEYFLVFASQHPLGLRKMKEAMRRIDQTGRYCFCAARVGQEELFHFNDPAAYALQMWNKYTGKRVTYLEVNDYALLQSPFTDPKSMLRVLEQQKKLFVRTNDPKRRRGTFNEEKIEWVYFLREGETYEEI